MDTLHTVVLHHALAGMIRARSLRGGYDVNLLWQHSLASSVYAGALAKKCRNVQVSEAVTAALLHDLGKVVVNVFNGDQVKQILDYKNARLGESLLAREERYVEASHNVYGAVLARHWQLPESLCLAIELHHHTNSHLLPDISPRVKELSAIVFAANQFAKLAGFHGNDMEIDWADSGLLEQIRLPYDIVAAFNAQPANLHNRAKMLVGL
jgi:putative nucleotidyltransferase with HDIG domain